MNNREISTKKPIDVVAIGNAIVDVLVHIEDSFLEKHGFTKGSMTLIDEQQAETLYSEIENGLQKSGGSAANTITGIAQLGGNAGFIGRVRNDSLGEIFTNDIKKAGAIFNTPYAIEGPSTARCMIFVTADAERTMCTYLGSSILLGNKNLNLSIVEESKILYLEGYLWDDNEAKKAFVKAAELSKENGGQVALSLSDSFCVNRHRKSFQELIDNYIDILFSNEEEIISLYQTSNLHEAINLLKGKSVLSAITLGKEGSIIIQNQHLYKIPPYKLGNTVDTTGAGDLYAGGFLYGYAKGEPIIRCGNIGSLCAAHIVTHLGARAKISLSKLVSTIL